MGYPYPNFCLCAFLGALYFSVYDYGKGVCSWADGVEPCAVRVESAESLGDEGLILRVWLSG